MTWMITGTTGFIGRALLNSLIQEPFSLDSNKFILLVRSAQKLYANLKADGISQLPDHFRVVEGDLHHLEKLKPHVKEITHVMHIAGLIDAKHKHPLFSTNLIGTQNLHQLLQAKTSRRLKWIQVSSIAANGPIDMSRAQRDPSRDQNVPTSWYGSSKLQADHYLREAHRAQDLIIVRPPAVFGKEDTAWLPLLRLIRRGIIPFWTGSHVPNFSFIDVTLLVETLRILMASPHPTGESLYPTFEKPLSWNQMMNLTRGVMSKGQRFQIPIPLSYGLCKLASKTFDALNTLPLIRRWVTVSGDKVRVISAGHMVKDGGAQLRTLGLCVPQDASTPWQTCVRHWLDSGLV